MFMYRVISFIIGLILYYLAYLSKKILLFVMFKENQRCSYAVSM